MAPSEETPYKRALPFEFTGSGAEYFKIWIVNLCLSIVTLGIYSAWAKVRRLRYFYGNTRLDGKSFSYLAEPVRILKGRLIAVLALVLYSLCVNFYPNAALLLLAAGLLMFPFILVLAVSFQLRNSAYRNVRFSFRRDFNGAYRVFRLPIGIILLLTLLGYEALGLIDFEAMQGEDDAALTRNDFLPTLVFLAAVPLLPYLDFVRTRFTVLNTSYGQHNTGFAARGRDFYAIYVIAFLLMLAAGFIGVMLMGGVTAVTGLGVSGMILSMGLMYALMFFVSGYLRARRTNLIYGSTRFGEMQLCSNLKPLPVGWLYLSNTIAIVLSLGLLIPWAHVRMARYVAACTELETRDLGSIVAGGQAGEGALGEEMLDAFDVDLGF